MWDKQVFLDSSLKIYIRVSYMIKAVDKLKSKE